MAKFKPAGKKGKGAPARQGALPCVVLVLSGILLLSLLFFFILKSSP